MQFYRVKGAGWFFRIPRAFCCRFYLCMPTLYCFNPVVHTVWPSHFLCTHLQACRPGRGTCGSPWTIRHSATSSRTASSSWSSHCSSQPALQGGALHVRAAAVLRAYLYQYNAQRLSSWNTPSSDNSVGDIGYRKALGICRRWSQRSSDGSSKLYAPKCLSKTVLCRLPRAVPRAVPQLRHLSRGGFHR